MNVDVFVSYPHADKPIADAAVNALESRGARCWVAPRDVPAGADWAGSIIEAIRRCRMLVLVFSDATNESDHILREIRAASDVGIPILPFRTTATEPEPSLAYYIGGTHWLDALTGPIEVHLAELADTVSAMLGTDRGSELDSTAVTAPVARSAAADLRLPWWNRVPAGPAIALAGVIVAAAIIIAVIASSGSGDEITEPVDSSEQPTTAATTPDAEETAVQTEPEDTPEAAPTVGNDREEPIESAPAAGAAEELEQDGEDADAFLGANAALSGRGSVVRVSMAGAIEADADSARPDISADGRFITFESSATNLVDDDSGSWRDVFVHDRLSGETERISQISAADGAVEANGDSRTPQISADGRFVIFASEATNLDPSATDTNGATDIYLHDRETGTTTLVSTRPDGTPHVLHSIEPSMSDDGTLIAYATYRDREVPYFGGPISALFTSWVYDHDDRTTRMLAEYPFSNPNVGVCTPVGPRVAADGSSAAADCGPNGAAFYDRSTDSVTQLSRGRQMNSSLPASGGQLIYFAGQDEGIWPAVKMDVFVMNADTEEYRRVSDLELTWTLGLWAASSDGRYVAIDGSDENSFNDAWVVDTQTGESLSLARDLGLALDDTRLRLSGSGGLAVFASGATDLVEGDTNGTVDIFVVQLQDDAAELAGG